MREKQLKLGLQNSRFYGPQWLSPPPPTEWSGSLKCASHSLFLLLPLSSTLPPWAPFNKSKTREGIDLIKKQRDTWRMCERGWISLWPWLWQQLWLLETWTESHVNTVNDLIATSAKIKYAILMMRHLANYERTFCFQTPQKSVVETFHSHNPIFFANSWYWNVKIYGTYSG